MRNRIQFIGWLIAWMLFAVSSGRAQSFTFSTLAGNSGYGIADGAGTNARFQSPDDVAADAFGNIYVADTQNSTLRRIDANGTVTTLAGLAGANGSSDGMGAAARFKHPESIATDAAGNIYVADTDNGLIRLVTPDGTVSTLAGSPGPAGNQDGKGTNALFGLPGGIAVDTARNIYVADTYNGTIRLLAFDGADWVVTTLAGFPGMNKLTDGSGTNAAFYQPSGIAVDGNQNLFVADTGNNAIRKITFTGGQWVTTTIAGTKLPTDISVDSGGNLFFASAADNTIRELTASGTNWVASTVAGLSGVYGSADGTNQARFNFPHGLATAPGRVIYVADTLNNTIRKISAAGFVTTVAGLAGGAGSADGTGIQARFDAPLGLTLDATGNLYVADGQNNTIRQITPTGVVTTLAGVATNGAGAQDGFSTNASFDFPAAIAIGSDHALYVADTDNNLIRKLTLAGDKWIVTSLAGRAGSLFIGTITNYLNDQIFLVSMIEYGSSTYRNYSEVITNISGGTTNLSLLITNVPFLTNMVSGHIHTNFLSTNVFNLPPAPQRQDGNGTNAIFHQPTGLALDKNGILYVADGGTNGVRIVTPDGTVSTPDSFSGSYQIGGRNLPFRSSGVAIDASGNIYIADAVNGVIREMSGGTLTTITGNPGSFGIVPSAITVDSQTNLYVADSFHHTILKLFQTGANWSITNVGGLSGTPGSVDGPGSVARFNGPQGIAVDSAGNLYVSDTGNNTIRTGQPAGPQAVMLQVTRDAQQKLVISWPASAAGYQLESKSPNSDWIQVPDQPVPSGASLVITNEANSGFRIYRLRKY